ncbi:MAG: transcriptional regulator, partial [Bacteroidota bacterium]
KVDAQGRHRYYSFANARVAYVVESLANLVSENPVEQSGKQVVKSGIKYCRTCYDHLAGYVGVTITNAMVEQEYLKEHDSVYHVTEEGWSWFSQFEIFEIDFTKDRRPLTRQCLDWSERRPHLAGRLGAIFLEKMLQDGWFKKVEFSRELIVTSRGSKFLDDHLKIVLR